MNFSKDELLVVVELICEQRYLADGNVFEYDFQFAKKKLQEAMHNQKNGYERYAIDPKKQKRILDYLDEEGYLQLDYVEEKIINNTGDTKRVNYSWKHGHIWTSDSFGAAQDILEFWNKFYINATYDDIKELKKKYIVKYVATLKLESQVFIVSCEGKEYNLKHKLHSGQTTDILEYVFGRDGGDGVVTRQNLIDADILKPKNSKKSFKDIFAGTRVLYNELAPFLKITTDTINLTPVVKLSADQFKLLQND